MEASDARQHMSAHTAHLSISRLLQHLMSHVADVVELMVLRERCTECLCHMCAAEDLRQGETCWM